MNNIWINLGCQTILDSWKTFSRMRIPKTLRVGLSQSAQQGRPKPREHIVNGVSYNCDEVTNVTDRILSYVNRNLHNVPGHPLSLLKRRIVTQINSQFPRKGRSPRFALLDIVSPIVTPHQNYDSLLVPLDHPSRRKSDAYYLNNDYLLRAHTSAHQVELIRTGLDHFLVAGDVYRRDEIDRTHYPVFHQMDAVSLLSTAELCAKFNQDHNELQAFEANSSKENRTQEKQADHTRDAVMLLSHDLKNCLITLVQNLFGKDVQTRWVDVYFPFTHPSWELEVYFNDEWIEVLGCGIMEQNILKGCGAETKIGWAFGIGLERLAMKLYSIPDIRLFWSNDTGFLSQFKTDDPNTPITYKPHSVYPQCSNDISFWIPSNTTFSKNDFFDLVRSIGGDMVEQVSLTDEFYHEKKKRKSQCYRITYRDMNRTLTQDEVNQVHNRIEIGATQQLGVEIR